jgi:pilus assembly protein CpaF
MISIVISEKGGAERREGYDQNEVTIGRVKGNDVLLPKGNVSKRHARLIMRDGRYIVTDLKSTNGTYVNHRRITHATLVREGDRIYIGDFVLRIESDASGDNSVAPVSPSFLTPDSSTSQSAFGRPSSGASPPLSAQPMGRPGSVDQEEIVSHFPIEHDPDDSSPMLDVPRPPRVPTGVRHFSPGAGPTVSSVEGPLTTEALTQSPTTGVPATPAIISDPQTPAVAASSTPAPDLQAQRARQSLLEQLLNAIEATIDLDALAAAQEPDEQLAAGVTKALDEELSKLIKATSLPPEVDQAELREAARCELLELGPLGPLVGDENITQVRVSMRAISVHRLGRWVPHGGYGYGSEAGVARAIGRLCAGAGAKLSTTAPYAEVTLADGRHLFIVRPGPSATGHQVVIKRPMRSRASLNGLVRSGAISRGMATLLAHCVAARANLLVAGAASSGGRGLVEALAAAAPASAATVWLSDPADVEPLPEGVASITLGTDKKQRLEAITAATKLAADHIIAPALKGPELANLLDAITHGTEGVVMFAAAGTLRQATDRLSVDLASARPGVSTQTAREWLGAAFDVGVEVTQLRDGRLRAVRLVEFRSGAHGTALRDIFTFAYHHTAAGGSIEGAFYASGTVPHIVEDLAARGMPLDTSIFRRHPSA